MKLAQVGHLGGWRGRGLDVLVGGLAVLGLAPFHFWLISLLAFSYLYVRMSTAAGVARHTRSSFGRGFWFALGYFAFGLYWIGSAFIARGAGFVWIMPFAIFLLCAGLALFWGLAGWFFAKFQARFGRWSWLWFIICMFTVEWLRGHVFGGFPWNLPGYIFEAGQPISQAAHMIGIYGLSLFVLFFAGSIGNAVMKSKYKPLALSIGLLTIFYGYGHTRLSSATVEYVPNVKLRLVHTNIAQKDKFDPAKYVDIANAHLALSASDGLDAITHVIWPEGALPGLMFEDPNLLAAIEGALSSGNGTTPIFIAQSLRTQQNGNKTDYYNAAAAVTFSKTSAPEVSTFYDKKKLVPFGEFIPGGGMLEKLGLHSLSTALASMTPGTGNTSPDLPGLPPVSIQICYEILFPGFTPKTVTPSDSRPEWILNLSNDSWYGNSLGPRQQANQAAYRAIETGLPVIRATSGGISAGIDPYGRNIDTVSIRDHRVLDVKLPKALKK